MILLTDELLIVVSDVARVSPSLCFERTRRDIEARGSRSDAGATEMAKSALTRVPRRVRYDGPWSMDLLNDPGVGV